MNKSVGKQTLNTVSIIPTIFLIIAGIGLIYWSYTAYKEKNALKVMGITTQGKVIEISENGIYKAPIIEFYTEDSVKSLFKSELEVSDDRYKVGDVVEVIYNPGDPTQAEINGFAERNFRHLFLGILGFALILLGIAIRFYYSRKAQKYG